MASSLPASYNGKFNLLVQITAASGKEEELAKHLAAVAKSSDSSKEPGTLLYHTARGFGSDNNKFTIFERPLNSTATQRLSKLSKASSAMGELTLTFYEDL
ncbi:hypothetical protein MPER_05781 [Moniliophthora perniciosa FA553]|nr:hypothetical protein MPER_05781 [Moniliophthora perniciosa FA553]